MTKNNPNEEMTPEEVARAEAYLNKLANSVLQKERVEFKQRVQGKDRRPVIPAEIPNPAPLRPSGESNTLPSGEIPRPPSSSPQVPLPPSRNTPIPARHTPLPVSARNPLTPLAGTPTPIAQRPNDTREGAYVGADGTFAVGTILSFEDKSIGIYKDKRTDKDYEVIYLMLPDGRVTPQGIALENYELKVIGVLPPEFMMRIQRRQRWDRDEIIYHLESFDYCKLVPYPTTQEIDMGTPRPTSARPPQEPRTLVTGRRFSINFGEREWNAVYWGEDELGPVVAHHTHDRWALMHLDLNRFKDSLVLGEMTDAALLKKIRDDISHK